MQYINVVRRTRTTLDVIKIVRLIIIGTLKVIGNRQGTGTVSPNSPD